MLLNFDVMNCLVRKLFNAWKKVPQRQLCKLKLLDNKEFATLFWKIYPILMFVNILLQTQVLPLTRVHKDIWMVHGFAADTGLTPVRKDIWKLLDFPACLRLTNVLKDIRRLLIFRTIPTFLHKVRRPAIVH